MGTYEGKKKLLLAIHHLVRPKAFVSSIYRSLLQLNAVSK
jgi:hypothetical protein